MSQVRTRLAAGAKEIRTLRPALNASVPRGATWVRAPLPVSQSRRVIVTLAALPILWTPNVVVARKVGRVRVAIPGALLFAADGWIATGYVFVWPIALLLSLGESLLPMGGALTVAALVGAIGGLVLGRHIDAGHGKWAVWYASATVAAIIVLRALETGSTTAAVVANALGFLGGCLDIPTLMTAVYRRAAN